MACMWCPLPGIGARTALVANHRGVRGCEGEEQPRAQLQVPWQAADGLNAGTSQQETARQHPQRAVFVWYLGLCEASAAGKWHL